MGRVLQLLQLVGMHGIGFTRAEDRQFTIECIGDGMHLVDTVVG